MEPSRQPLLREIPSVNDLLKTETASTWLQGHPRSLVVDSIRVGLDQLRQAIINDTAGRCGRSHVTIESVLDRIGVVLAARSRPKIVEAINATGIILHTALGRAVYPACVVEDIVAPAKGYATLAIDRESGLRSERDNRIEPILCELTGAEAACVVNNNAGATLLVLAALCAGKEVIVSRGQLIEIGGSFRLPDVMAQSGARMVEVGATNRTHLRDYAAAINDQTAGIFRAHPSNFRIVGFSKEVPTAELAELARERSIYCIDDLGAGALIELEQFGLGGEPTVQQSLAAGADVALFSGDKLIGASQCGILVGKAEAIARIRKHPLARALRPDKICLMVLERTLALFRDIEQLKTHHPLYRMLATSTEQLKQQARELAGQIEQIDRIGARAVEGFGYLGSGSLPDESLETWLVQVDPPSDPARLARALRMDEACIFSRIEDGCVMLDVRTLLPGQAELIAPAIRRCVTVD